MKAGMLPVNGRACYRATKTWGANAGESVEHEGPARITARRVRTTHSQFDRASGACVDRYFPGRSYSYRLLWYAIGGSDRVYVASTRKEPTP